MEVHVASCVHTYGGWATDVAPCENTYVGPWLELTAGPAPIRRGRLLRLTDHRDKGLTSAHFQSSGPSVKDEVAVLGPPSLTVL